jgi:hypothetical protein
MLALLIVVVVYAIQFAVIARVLLRPGMLPTVRLSWVMVVAVVPIAGLFLYLLFGEVRLARGKVRRITEVLDSLAEAQRQTPARTGGAGAGRAGALRHGHRHKRLSGGDRKHGPDASRGRRRD